MNAHPTTAPALNRVRFLLALLLFSLLTSLLPTPSPLLAQSQPAPYWQYAASARLKNVIPADLDGDGVAEFIVVDELGRVTLVNAKGELEWNLAMETPVTAVGLLPLSNTDKAEQALLLGTENELILLTNYGDELWRIPVTAVPTPTSLLTSGGYQSEAEWQENYPAIPAAILPYDADQDGRSEILLLLNSGQMQLFDQEGALLWRYTRNTNPVMAANPTIIIDDFDPGLPGDEILLGLFNPRRFSQLMLVDGQGNYLWEHNISGRMTALTTITINGRPHIAVGTSRGEIILYDAGRQRLWLRTLNKPITNLVAAQTPDGPILVAGTNVGMLVAYDAEGRRVWAQELAPNADAEVQSISAAPFTPQENQPMLAVLLRPNGQREEAADVLLLNSDGRILERFAQVDTTNLSLLVDANGDQLSELLLTRFATVELQGLGIGSSKVATEWEYDSLFAPPTAVLVTDLNGDGVDNILIGAQDGRLHHLNNEGVIQWIVAPGGEITHLASLRANENDPAQIVIIHADGDAENTQQSILEMRQLNGDRLWQQTLEGPTTTLAVADLNNSGVPEIIVGNSQGEVFVYDHNGNSLWHSRIDGPASQFLIRSVEGELTKELLVVSNNLIFSVGPNQSPRLFIVYPENFTSLYFVNRDKPTADLAAIISDETFTLFTGQGVQFPGYPIPLNGRSQAIYHYQEPPANNANQPAPDAFLIATEDGALLNLRLSGSQTETVWELDGMEAVTSIYHGNLDEDILPEIAVGDSSGNIYILTETPEISERLNVVSGVFALTPVTNRENNSGDLLAADLLAADDLLVATDNGLVQLFRAKENRPPLLTNPQADSSEGQTSFSVSVQDVERDQVTVNLDIFDPETGEWAAQEEKQVSGSGNLVWPGVALPDPKNAADYRFRFDDGFHEGTITPPPVPAPPPPAATPPRQTTLYLAGAALAFFGLGAIVLLARQMRTPTAQASRFYRHLKQHPQRTLPLLEEKFHRVGGASDFFVNLANEARQQADLLITKLADGLFLLTDRPQAGISILENALDEVGEFKREWEGAARWTATFSTARLLLEAPSITELSLQRPQLRELITLLAAENNPSPILEELLPILTNLRDSERVDRTDDRLIYLSEANLLTNLLLNNMGNYPITIGRTLVWAVLERWSGLLGAEIEELRGQAELDITLKTKHVLPLGKTDLVLEIANNGRSPAENIMVALDNNPAYTIYSDPKIISFLPPRRTWQITFTIEPKVSDRFRLSLTVTYDDRNKLDREIAFGDMVHMLTPSREFQPIPNPYLPGTPLRQDSTLFYGRENLFAFIADNAVRLSQRNVLILFGQRRTGKTSILLRLQQHLPENVLPVYIDCQSLGVTRGMPALLSDLAWQIADALATRQIEIDVPGRAAWQDEPTVVFQRRFLPEVRKLLPADTLLLLLFDEFEAFENLVNDGLLPPTFFTYMRHLMQHSQGLSFIFVGTHRLEEMTADYWSVLFNMALYENIGYLNEEAMTRLIREPVAPFLVYDDLALDKIQRVTAGHPYFLQLVCYTLVKRANAQRSTYITISNVNAALDEMMLLGEVHFAYIWQRSSFAEKGMLTAVSHLMEADVLFHPEDLMRYLEAYGIHLTPTEVTTALNSLTQREILAEVSEGVTTMYELKTGLIGLWVAKYKSLSKLHAEREAEG